MNPAHDPWHVSSISNPYQLSPLTNCQLTLIMTPQKHNTNAMSWTWIYSLQRSLPNFSFSLDLNIAWLGLPQPIKLDLDPSPDWDHKTFTRSSLFSALYLLRYHDPNKEQRSMTNLIID